MFKGQISPRGRKSDLEIFQKFFQKIFCPKIHFYQLQITFSLFFPSPHSGGLRLSNFHVIFCKKLFAINSFYLHPTDSHTQRGITHALLVFHKLTSFDSILALFFPKLGKSAVFPNFLLTRWSRVKSVLIVLFITV